jgi:predicted Zn-dependent protease
MRTHKVLGVGLALLLLVSTSAYAEKIKGYIWDIQGTAVVVEGVTVQIVPNTKFERSNHKGITLQDLRIGWEAEVDAEKQGSELVAKKLEIKNKRNDDVKVEGFVVEASPELINVDGYEVRWPTGLERPASSPGMRLKGKGIALDDTTIALEEAEVMPRGFNQDEAEFMFMAQKEIRQLKESIEFYSDPELQAYVSRVGRSLVPDWVDPNELRFDFGIVDDPTLNAFALPDGTVVVHTGLLAVLENEAQLATVLGHEISHVTHRHGYRGYKNAKKWQWLQIGALAAGVAVDAATDNSWAGTLVGLGSGLTISAAVNGHGRNLEDDADRIGLHYAVGAGYDPYEAPEVWHTFDEHVSDQNAVVNWFFSDHSTHQARISNLTREINANYRGNVDRSSFKTNEAEYARMTEKLRRRTAKQNYQRKEYKSAAKYFSSALRSNPRDAEAHLYMGKILWDAGGLQAADGALQAFRAAAGLEPGYADPYRGMGVVYHGMSDYRAAVESFETYLRMRPNAPEARQIRTYVSRYKS